MTSESGITVSTTETSPVLRTLEVEVDAKRVRKAFDRAYKDLAKTAKVRGFRPGKVPRSVLEKLYGAGMAEEIERLLVSETLPDAVEQSGVKPVAEPSIDADAPKAGDPFRYRASIEVKPPIELPELTGLPGKKPEVVVGPEDIEEELDALRERRAELVDEGTDTPAARGSHLTVDYAGSIDGELFEGGSAEGATIELGAGRLIPGFEEQLEGACAGESREVRVTFPDEYPAAELAGKEAVFAVTVHAVKTRRVPELTDELAKALPGDFETVDALKDHVKEEITSRREREAKSELRRTVLDALIERTEFDAPAGMIDRRLDQRLQMAHQQLAQVVPHDELHQRLDQWREEWRADAERDVRETLLLEAVAEAQGCEASEEEVEERLEQTARDQGIDLERLRQAYAERGMLDAVAAQICEEKALEFLLAEANVEVTTGT